MGGAGRRVDEWEETPTDPAADRPSRRDFTDLFEVTVALTRGAVLEGIYGGLRVRAFREDDGFYAVAVAAQVFSRLDAYDAARIWLAYDLPPPPPMGEGDVDDDLP